MIRIEIKPDWTRKLPATRGADLAPFCRFPGSCRAWDRRGRCWTRQCRGYVRSYRAAARGGARGTDQSWLATIRLKLLIVTWEDATYRWGSASGLTRGCREPEEGFGEQLDVYAAFAEPVEDAGVVPAGVVAIPGSAGPNSDDGGAVVSSVQ